MINELSFQAKEIYDNQLSVILQRVEFFAFVILLTVIFWINFEHINIGLFILLYALPDLIKIPFQILNKKRPCDKHKKLFNFAYHIGHLYVTYIVIFAFLYYYDMWFIECIAPILHLCWERSVDGVINKK